MNSPALLIVEDDPCQLTYYTLLLQQLSSTITTATNALQAFEILQHSSPDLALIDVFLPEMQGVDLVRYIRADERLRSTKVILFTSSPEDLDHADKQLPDLFLTKPVSTASLEEAVRTLLEAGADLVGQPADGCSA